MQVFSLSGHKRRLGRHEREAGQLRCSRGRFFDVTHPDQLPHWPPSPSFFVREEREEGGSRGKESREAGKKLRSEDQNMDEERRERVIKRIEQVKYWKTLKKKVGRCSK